MKTKLGIVAVLLIVIGFGMVHGGSQTMERIAIGLMGIGIVHLLYLLLSKGEKGPINPPGE
jgi:multisubunit Na+/H+ antiporter MnhC subunit